MKLIIQRVQQAQVVVHKKEIASIKKGLLVLIGIKEGDTRDQAAWLIKKLLKLRIFEDDSGKMNRSVTDMDGAILMVPNFTLYADATKGNRPSFVKAAAPDEARILYEKTIERLKELTQLKVETGQFGAHMEVNLLNDGPVTIVLEKS